MLLLSAAVISFACTNAGSVSNTARENSATPAVSATPVPASPERPERETSKDVPADLEITLSRNACYGRCPVYSMSVKADGSVEFDGKQFTEAVGKTSGTITTGDVLRIFNKFEKIVFFELDNEYTEANCPMSATDLSTYIVSVTANGKTKKISHYTGCVENDEQHTPYPPGLLDLENKIQDIAESKGWIK
jgi:hypothetical protein